MKHIDFSSQSDDYRRIEKAIRFIEANFKQQPTLDQMAASVHLSKFHFNRVFKRWAGISPGRFLQFLTLDYTKRQLAESKSLLSTALDAGLSGPGRLHDLFVAFEAITPGQFKSEGDGLQIRYGFSASPFGEVMAATTDRGICRLSFLSNGDRADLIRQLKEAWPRAVMTEDDDCIGSLVGRIFNVDQWNTSDPIQLHTRGTNFQVNVWRALLTIPSGRLVSYQDVATYLGKPNSVRAVAGAVAVNPVAYLIPCHRVIAKTGKTHNYRWGAHRKKAMIGWEAASIPQGAISG